MDLVFVFLTLFLAAGFCYSFYRLLQLRTVANLSLCAAQLAVFAFFVFSGGGGLYREPFVLFFYFLAAFAAPAICLCSDIFLLRKKLGEKFGLTLTAFLYRDEREEMQKSFKKEKYVETMLKPQADNLDIEEISNEIRVERADTSKNIHRQLEAAQKKYNEDDIEGALFAYVIIEKVFNRSPSLYYNIGNLECMRAKFDSAARYYRRGIECAGLKEFENDDMAKKLGMIYYNLGNASFRTGRYQKAISAYKDAVQANPDMTDAYYNMSFCHAMDYEETGDTEKAVEAFGKLVEDMPENLHAWFHYGKCLLKMKKTAQAIDCFHKVVGEDIMFYEAWYRLAIAYDESGMTADAVKSFYTSIQIKPDFIDAYNNLGVLLSTAGRHGEALKVLKNALKIKPGDTELIFNIGMIYYESGRREEALNEFMTCAKLRPDDAAVFYMISLIYMKLNNPGDSMLYLERAVKKDPAIGERALKEPAFLPYRYHNEYGKLFAQ